jgi:hypothetical protein
VIADSVLDRELDRAQEGEFFRNGSRAKSPIADAGSDFSHEFTDEHHTATC